MCRSGSGELKFLLARLWVGHPSNRQPPRRRARRVAYPMILDEVSWMNIRRFRVLHQAGATYAEIARECGCDWRTVRKYLAAEGPVGPPKAPPRAGTQPALITPRR